MKISKSGYKKGSKDNQESSLKIPGSSITMKNVPHLVLGIGENGIVQLMEPGKDYHYGDASYVNEYPVKKYGGGLKRDEDRGSDKKPYPSVSKSDFARPGSRSYPIPTKADAQDALRLAHLHGATDVIAKVHAKYPDLQYGGTLSPQQWYQKNINAGYKVANQFGSGEDVNGYIARGKYPSFYDPKQYAPGAAGFTNIQNPNLKEGDSGYNPLIDYHPPVKQPVSRPGKAISDSNRTAISFGNNSTTYRYNDGRIVTYDMQGNEIKPVTSYKFGGEGIRSTTQGRSQDQFLENKTQEFKDYIASNVMKSLLQSGIKEFQMGGENGDPTMYQDNMVSGWSGPAKNPIAPQPMTFASAGDLYGHFGNMTPWAPAHPDKNSLEMKKFVETPNGNSGMSFGEMLKTDPGKIDTPQTMTSQTSSIPTELGIMGLFNILNRSLDDYNTGLNERKLKQWSTIENTVGKDYGSRGDYDVNTGVFRPNQNTPHYKSGGIHIKKSHEGKFTAYKKRTGKTTEEALHSKDPHVRQMANFARNARKWHHEDGGEQTFYKKGGSYDLDYKQVLDLIRQGYKINFE